MATPLLQRARQAMMALRTSKRFDRLSKTVILVFWCILQSMYNKLFLRVGRVPALSVVTPPAINSLLIIPLFLNDTYFSHL